MAGNNIQIHLPVEAVDSLLGIGQPQAPGAPPTAASVAPTPTPSPAPVLKRAAMPPVAAITGGSAPAVRAATLKAPAAAPHKYPMALRVLGDVGEALGSEFIPRAMPFIPGTPQHRMGRILTQQEQQSAGDVSNLRHAQANREGGQEWSVVPGTSTEVQPATGEARQIPGVTPLPHAAAPHWVMAPGSSTAINQTSPTLQTGQVPGVPPFGGRLTPITVVGPNGQPEPAYEVPGEGVYDAKGTLIQNPQTYEKPIAPKTATIMVGGKPTIVPVVTGPDGSLHADVANPIGEAPPTYAQVMPGTKTYVKMGEDGLPHIYNFEGNDLGISATGAYGHEMAQAGAVVRGGDELIKSLQANRGSLGTLSAWVQKHGLNTPIANPKLAGLQSELASFAALQPAMHGFRSRSAQQAFQKIIGGLQQNPDATIASIRSIMKTAGYINPAMAAPKASSTIPRGARPVVVDGKTIGYTTDGKSMIRFQ